MSRVSAAVRFPDGTIRYTTYSGLVDVLWGRLFPTIDEAWDAYDRWDDFPPAPSEGGEPVDIFADYDGGWLWRGTATPDYVTSPTMLEHIENPIDCDKAPDWVVWK